MNPRITRAWRLSSWVNDINPVNWKTVIVGYMQIAFIFVVLAVWAFCVIAHALREKRLDMQTEVLYVLSGLLAGLSGITLVGRNVDRKTDYGYVERINEGKRIEASTAPTPQVTVTGDSPNVTATMPVVPAASAQSSMPPAPRAAVAVTAQAIESEDDQGLG